MWTEKYGGTGQYNGNGAWADYPWYGTNKFFFIEDNTILGNGTNVLSGNTDSVYGARYVMRHNYFQNSSQTATEPKEEPHAVSVVGRFTITRSTGQFR